MELHDAWRVDNTELDARYDAFNVAHAAADKATNRRRLFHGTPKDNAYAIHAGGFRLPMHA
eukprot:5931758-Prymnesium_polylepis.1